ncbi:MAG: hypothetical protein U0R26_10385 [Solirubrobacterales bacterium]
MKRFKKLVLTVAALAALAVGGSAFAQAQFAKNVAMTTVLHRQIEPSTPGDRADTEAGAGRDQSKDGERADRGADGEHQDQGSAAVDQETAGTHEGTEAQGEDHGADQGPNVEEGPGEVGAQADD